MYGLSPVSEVHSAKQRSIKLMRRTVSNNPAGILFNEVQAAKQAVNTMLVLVVPIAENNFSGIVSSAEHSAKVSSNLSIFGQPAKRLSGRLFKAVQPKNIRSTYFASAHADKRSAGRLSKAVQSVKVPAKWVALTQVENNPSGKVFNEVQPVKVLVNFNFAEPNGLNKSAGIFTNFGQL